MRVRIKDFEIIENLDLTIPNGLTIITGDSNNGKSSIFKAIRAILYNKHSDLKIRKGTSSYTIAIQDGANTVICRRNASKQVKTAYQVNGNDLTKVGRNAIIEVEDAMNIKPIDILNDSVELNFVKQFAYPFLLDKTPSQLYNFLANSYDTDKFMSLVTTMKNDLKEMSDSIKRYEGSLDTLATIFKDNQNKYNIVKGSGIVTDFVFSMDKDFKKYSIVSNLLASMEKDIQDNGYYKSHLDTIGGILNALGPINQVSNQIDNLTSLRGFMEELREEILKREGYKKTYKSLNDKLNVSTKEIDKRFNDLNSLKSQVDSLRSLTNEVDDAILNNNQINSILDTQVEMLVNDKDIHDFMTLSRMIIEIDKSIETINHAQDNLQDANTRIDKIKEELNEFKVCPLCGNELINE